MADEQMRSETDSMGAVEVPADRYWGAQTERARHHFAIGRDLFPLEIIRAVAEIKRAAAAANAEIGVLDGHLCELIRTAADEIIAGRHDGEFPLHVWMTGSGTQANMNVNEVISNRAIELAGGVRGSKDPVHPNDHVNRSQSSNDVIPTALNVAAAVMIASRLLPALAILREGLAGKARQWRDVVKIGRTHMQDAVPMTLGQEFAGYVGMLDDNVERLAFAQKGLMRLAIGGTAVGTGLNAPTGFDAKVASELASRTGLPFEAAANKFAVMGAHDAMVMASGTLRVLAVSLHKIANDIRLLACGPRAGFAELVLPENEPGSSIMPGKVNPTQCEALAMLTVQVMGLDAATGFAGAGGLLDMNVYKPMIGANVIESCRMLADGMEHFAKFAVAGMEANESRLRETVNRSLMLVTALTPEIGYDKAAAIAHHAHHEGLTLREAALALGHIDAATFDRIVDPASMTGAMPDLG